MAPDLHEVGNMNNGFEGGFERLEGWAEEQAEELWLKSLRAREFCPKPVAFAHMPDGLLIAHECDDKWYEV